MILHWDFSTYNLRLFRIFESSGFMTSEFSDLNILDFTISIFWDWMIFGIKDARILGSYNSKSLGFHNLGLWVLERLKNWNF